jgi:hypothetical protein
MRHAVQTRWYKIFQGVSNVKGSSVCDSGKLSVIGDDRIWPQIVSGKSECNVKAFVTKNSLLLTEDRVCKFGVELVSALKTVCACFDKFNRDSLIGIGRPWLVKSA